MKLTTKLIAFTIIVSSYSCASTPTPISTPTDEAIASAVKARKAAADVGYEWTTTGQLIKEAKELAAKGKSDEAIKLAQMAEEQGVDALNQYRREMDRYSSSQ